MVKLIVMSGIPGSGKSTFAAKLARKEGALVVSMDNIRKQLYGDASINDEPGKVFGLMVHRAKKALRKGQSVVIDCTSVTKRDRTKYLRILKGRFDFSECVFMDTPIEECIRRNAARERIVPEEAIRRMHENLEFPTDAEAFDVTKIITYGGEKNESRGSDKKIGRAEEK